MTAPKESSSFRFSLLELETFLAVVDNGSFHAAASRLHVSQPAVTQRVQKLEAILKTRLLIRTTRRMELTPAGLELYDRATRALSELRALLDDFQSEADSVRRRVVVAASPIIAALSLPVIIRQFSERYPAVDIHIRDMQYSEILSAIHNGEVDLGLVAFEGDTSLFSFEPLGEDDVVLVVPQDHALASLDYVPLATLSEYPLLLLQQYDRIAAELSAVMLKHSLTAQVAQRVTNLTTLLAMVDAGHGVALLPRSMAQMNAPQPRRTLSLESIRLTRCFGILASRRHTLTHSAERFCEQLRVDFASTLAPRTD